MSFCCVELVKKTNGHSHRSHRLIYMLGPKADNDERGSVAGAWAFDGTR